LGATFDDHVARAQNNGGDGGDPPLEQASQREEMFGHVEAGQLQLVVGEH